jgi:hypothetical protein
MGCKVGTINAYYQTRMNGVKKNTESPELKIDSRLGCWFWFLVRIAGLASVVRDKYSALWLRTERPNVLLAPGSIWPSELSSAINSHHTGDGRTKVLFEDGAFSELPLLLSPPSRPTTQKCRRRRVNTSIHWPRWVRGNQAGFSRRIRAGAARRQSKQKTRKTNHEHDND